MVVGGLGLCRRDHANLAVQRARRSSRCTGREWADVGCAWAAARDVVVPSPPRLASCRLPGVDGGPPGAVRAAYVTSAVTPHPLRMTAMDRPTVPIESTDLDALVAWWNAAN